jgi:2-polyprenyl-6-hydroxyphenyl methylase/3-demethylubiquinone-9 3-methyltransferase
MTMQSSIDEQEIAKFAQHEGEWWSKDGVFKTLHDINPLRISFIEQYCQLNGLNVLDLGCGGGILAEAMALLNAHVTGLDAGIDCIKAAKIHANKMKFNIDYVCSPIETFDGGDFDVITCMEMLEHVEKPEFVIESASSRLKTDGFLFLSTINRTLKAYGAAIIAAEYILGLLPRQTHDYSKFIRPAELAAMVRAHGLEVVGLSGMSYIPLLGKAYMTRDVNVNYLMVCRKI